MKRFTVALAFASLSTAASADPYVFAGSLTLNNEAGLGYSLGAGYRFGKHFGLEASFQSPNHFEETHSFTGNPPFSSTFDRIVDGNFSSLSAVGSIPLSEKFSLIGRLSAHRIKADVSEHFVEGFTVKDPVTGVITGVTTRNETVNRSIKEWAPGVGVGASFDFTPKFAVRSFAEWVGETSETTKFRFFTIQGVYTF